jgi:sugar diacid utilization regulator
VDDEHSRAAFSRLEPGSLRFRSQSVQGVVVPEPDAPGQRERLARLLAGCAAVVGPAVPLDNLPLGDRIARVATDLRRSGVLRDRPVFVDDHLGALIIHREPRLLEGLQRRRLAPLQGAAPGTRATLQDTLRAWLVHMGDNRRVAEELHVHPQTVRYRLTRLRELFGEDLDDPRLRLELLLALAWD